VLQANLQESFQLLDRALVVLTFAGDREQDVVVAEALRITVPM
jgi:hypothetical protein